MGKIIVENAVKREKGYLYYVDKEGNICRSKMKYLKEKEKKGE